MTTDMNNRLSDAVLTETDKLHKDIPCIDTE